MKKDNAINFLLYSYFGITLESSADEIVGAAINRAYQDASSHVLALTDEVKSEVASHGNPYKEECAKKLREFVQQLVEIQSQEDYTAKHKALSQELTHIYAGKAKEERSFTYGVAQKWINMTTKYLCVILAAFEEFNENHDYCKTYSAALHKCEVFFHIPLDSFILEFVSQKPGQEKIEGALNVEIPAKSGENCYYSDKAIPWSKYNDYDQYRSVEDAIKANISESPLDWEGPAWIKVSRKRNHKLKH